MRTGFSFLLAALLSALPAQLAIKSADAKGGRPRSTSPACPLKCPAGFQDALYSWELHPEHTAYDDQGKTIVPPDSVWRVSCSLKCEQHAVNKPTKSWSENQVLCRSGGEPAPYRGPWRIVGQFTRECAARANNGCGMQCYEIRTPPPPKKKR
jgi:hypothetical protein